MSAGSALVPAVVLAGRNGLSVVRSLGRAGVPVYVPGSRPNVRLAASRYVRRIPVPAGRAPLPERLLAWLLGPEARPIHGAVILACNDSGVEMLARHREELLPLYRLDLCNPRAQLTMLDKLATYRLAAECGVEAPAMWTVEDDAGLDAVRDELRFPLIVKPRSSAAFQRRFAGGRKHLRARTIDEARGAIRTMRESGLTFILVEFVPGPDTLGAALCTYLDERGDPAFLFTMRFLRRSPPNEGEACYVLAERVPELVEPSLRLLRHAGLRGLAQVEFKLDPRDGRLKLIECNGRFIGPNPLLVACGLDLAPWIYRRALGLPAGALPEPRLGVRLWDPRRDRAAYRALARAGGMTLADWLRSLRPARTFWFSPTDPLPTFAHTWHLARGRVQRAFDRRGRLLAAAASDAADGRRRTGRADIEPDI